MTRPITFGEYFLIILNCLAIPALSRCPMSTIVITESFSLQLKLEISPTNINKYFVICPCTFYGMTFNVWVCDVAGIGGLNNGAIAEC